MTNSQWKKQKAKLYNLRRAEVLAYKENEVRCPSFERAKPLNLKHLALLAMLEVSKEIYVTKDGYKL